MNKLYYSLIIGILFAVFVWSGSVLAADIEFSAYVDKSALSLTDYLTFTLEVKGAVGSLPAPEIGELEDFRILSGPNESTSIQWINGAMSASKTITFILQPKREGELTIPSAVVTHKRKRYTTEPLTIKVYQGAASSPQSQPRSSTPRQGGQRAPDETKEMGDLFLKVETDRTSLVQNDMVIVTYKLYMLVNVSTY
nr:BatD family protein [FCB group bacterium]